MTVKAMTPATKIEKLQEAIANGYRALQSELKALRDAKLVSLHIEKLTISFEDLKAEAQRLIDGYKPIAEVDSKTATYDEQVKKVMASLPEHTIADNCDFGARINKGTDQEKYWLRMKDRNGDGVTFIKGGGNIYHYAYAGDALRIIALFGTPIVIEKGVLCTNIRDFDLESFMQKAKKLGLKVHLNKSLFESNKNNK